MKKIFTTIFSIVLLSGISLLAQTTPDYLCFTANEDGSIVQLRRNGYPQGITIEYQKNGTAEGSWLTYATPGGDDFFGFGEVLTLNKNEKVYFRNASDDVKGFSNSNYSDGNNIGFYQFYMEGSIAASGNVMSLVDKSCATTEIPCEGCFMGLFGLCSCLTSAPELPATMLKKYCYGEMFTQCTALEKAPVLRATALADSCYHLMFSYCYSLTDAPELPSMTLADACYSNMFAYCTNLEEAPELPAMTLADNCYNGMFTECTSLTAAPALPAETLASGCYSNMFSGCTSLTEAPELPATTLAPPIDEDGDGCYANMFSGCTSLTAAPALPATTLAEWCYYNMFGSYCFMLSGETKYCSSLTEAPALPATTLKAHCYSSMFSGCTSLTAAPALPATALAEGCYYSMFSGCSSLTGVPAKLPAETLAEHCYNSMFSSCTSLTAAPALPATALAEGCYYSMFQGCTSLTAAPALPAKTLAPPIDEWGDGCYACMFAGCISLEKAPELPAMTLTKNCYNSMFAGCSSLEKAPELPATTLASGCYVNMFGYSYDGESDVTTYCSKLNYVKVGFTDWNASGHATGYEDVGWLDGVSATGTFVCPIDLEQKTGSGYIPEGWTVKHPVKAHADEESGIHYATFYSGSKAYKLENATAYAGGELDSSVGDEIVLALMPLNLVGNVIPADVPVVLKSSQSEILISETSESGTAPAANSLKGTDVVIDVQDGNGIKALSLGQHGIGFYPWAGKSIGAHRAYYKPQQK